MEPGHILEHTPSLHKQRSSSMIHEGNVECFCRLCTHCKSGIVYDTSYFQCCFCQLYFCNACAESHPLTHRQNLRRMISKQTLPNALRSEKSCHGCSKVAHCRHDCQECGRTFCNDCHVSHKHGSFTSIEPPFHSLKISDVSNTHNGCTEITVSNCSRCQSCKSQHSCSLDFNNENPEAIDLGQAIIQCKTCLINYDDTVKLCQSCRTESWISHDQSHEIISLKFQPVEDEAQSGFGCGQCDEKFNLLDKSTLARHGHSDYVLNLGPQTREIAVSAAYRLCQRKSSRKDRPQVMECARCKHDFPSQTLRFCAGNCEGTFCDECFPLASLSHVHGPTNFRSLNDETCPEIGFLPAGWRAMRNSERRIYYLQDDTSKFTFEKPRLPDTLPAGWVEMSDMHGRPVYFNSKTNSTTQVNPIFGLAPEGWDLMQNETGRLYYVNSQTKATTWHKPQPLESNSLPPGYEVGQHSDGRVYYIDHYKQITSWTKPTLPAVAASPHSPVSSDQTRARSSTVPAFRNSTPVGSPVMVQHFSAQSKGPPAASPGPMGIISTPVTATRSLNPAHSTHPHLRFPSHHTSLQSPVLTYNQSPNPSSPQMAMNGVYTSNNPAVYATNMPVYTTTTTIETTQNPMADLNSSMATLMSPTPAPPYTPQYQIPTTVVANPFPTPNTYVQTEYVQAAPAPPTFTPAVSPVVVQPEPTVLTPQNIRAFGSVMNALVDNSNNNNSGFGVDPGAFGGVDFIDPSGGGVDFIDPSGGADLYNC